MGSSLGGKISVMSTDEQRRRLRAWRRAHRRYAAWWYTTELGRMGVPVPLVPFVTFDMLGLACGARTRAGTPCKRIAAPLGNGRCKLHGGASTGPRTAPGKAPSAATRLF